MKKISLFSYIILFFINSFAQKHVGIGTTNPLAALHVADSSVLFTGPFQFQINPPPPPVNGAGGRMMWYPSKGAFRAGAVDADQWDQFNLGYTSFASGYNTKAIGSNATAMGSNTIASGQNSTAQGFVTIASGNESTALGNQTTASGNSSTAMGNLTIASGINSTAMGVNANTANYTNSFCIAGAPGNIAAVNTTDNQMMMRFDNYTFWVSSANFAYLIPASNGWAYTSDINKKERFEELNGETVLKKISKIPSYSWNFKANDTKQYRHYGIMAQDFYNAFGKDSYGAIGNDTTVSPLDLLGVAYSGIKALEKRSTALAKENEQLKEDNLALQKRIGEIEKQVTDKIAILEIKMNVMAAFKEKMDEGKKYWDK
jgi:hypothetical protein